MKYYVVKSTKNTDGSFRTPVITAYDTKDLAEQAYFTACAEASTTSLGMYAVKMLTEELAEVAGRTFLKNNLPEPEFIPEEL